MVVDVFVTLVLISLIGLLLPEYRLWLFNIWEKRKRWNRIIIVIAIVSLFSYKAVNIIAEEKAEEVKVKPQNYKSVNAGNIPYVQNPWDISLGFVSGETVGIIMQVDNMNYYAIKFDYLAKNCWTSPLKHGQLSFRFSNANALKYFYGKKCLVIGTARVKEIKTPMHACDNTYGIVDMDISYVELSD